MSGSESRSIVVRKITNYSKDKELRDAYLLLMKISANIYNDLLDVVFGKEFNDRSKALVHHGKPHEGMILTNYIFSVTRDKGKTTYTPLPLNKYSKYTREYRKSIEPNIINSITAEYLVQYLKNHDSNGNRISYKVLTKEQQQHSLYHIIKNKHCPILHSKVYENLIKDFWNMFRSADSLTPDMKNAKRKYHKDRYPKQRFLKKKEKYKIRTSNNNLDGTILTIVNPFSLRGHKDIADIYVKAHLIFKKFGKIDLRKTIDDGSKFDLSGTSKPDIIINSNLINEITFTLSYNEKTELSLGRKQPYEIEGMGYMLYEDDNFNKRWDKIKKDNKKLSPNERISMRKVYLEHIAERGDSCLVIDPNIKRVSIVNVSNSDIVHVINLDISDISRQHKKNMNRKRSIKSKITKNSGNKILTSYQYKKQELYMVEYRKNFQHYIATAIADIADQVGAKHILFGNGARYRKKMKRFPNMKNISYNTITKYLQELCRERGIIFTSVDEKYTSKASYLEGEKSEHSEEYAAKRGKKDRHTLTIKTGGTTVDADINAACNIAVKHGMLKKFSELDSKKQFMVHNPRKITLDFSNKVII